MFGLFYNDIVIHKFNPVQEIQSYWIAIWCLIEKQDSKHVVKYTVVLSAANTEVQHLLE